MSVIDAGDLAAWAQARGQTVAFHKGTGGKEGHTAADGYDSEGQVPGVAPGQTGANEGKAEGTGDKQGQAVAFDGDTEGHVTGASGGDPAARLAVLEAQVRALQDERDYLRQALATAQRTLEHTTKALPPARDESIAIATQDEQRMPWWRRVLGHKGG